MELDSLPTDCQAAKQEQKLDTIWLKALQCCIMIWTTTSFWRQPCLTWDHWYRIYALKTQKCKSALTFNTRKWEDKGRGKESARCCWRTLPRDSSQEVMLLLFGGAREGEVKGEGRNVECVTAHSSFCVEDFEQCAARRGAVSQTWQWTCFFCCISSFMMSSCTHRSLSPLEVSQCLLLPLLFSSSWALQHLHTHLHGSICFPFVDFVNGAPLKGTQVEDSEKKKKKGNRKK